MSIDYPPVSIEGIIVMPTLKAGNRLLTVETDLGGMKGYSHILIVEIKTAALLTSRMITKKT